MDKRLLRSFLTPLVIGVLLGGGYIAGRLHVEYTLAAEIKEIEDAARSVADNAERAKAYAEESKRQSEEAERQVERTHKAADEVERYAELLKKERALLPELVRRCVDEKRQELKLEAPKPPTYL